MRRSASSGSRFKRARLGCRRTAGVAPRRTIVAALAKNEKAGHNTASPGPTSRARSASQIASVPELQQTACGAPQARASSASKARTGSPCTKRPLASSFERPASSSGSSASCWTARSCIGIAGGLAFKRTGLRGDGELAVEGDIEVARREALGPGAQRRRAELELGLFEAFDRPLPGLPASGDRRRLRSPRTGDRRPRGRSRPGTSTGAARCRGRRPRQGNHGPAGGLGLDRDQAKVLALRVDERSTPPIKFSQGPRRPRGPTNSTFAGHRARERGDPVHRPPRPAAVQIAGSTRGRGPHACRGRSPLTSRKKSSAGALAGSIQERSTGGGTTFASRP